MSLDPRRPHPLLLLPILALLLFVPALLPDSGHENAPVEGGLRVQFDPESQTLVPGHATTDLEKALGPNFRSAKDLVPVHHPNGAVSLDLQGRFRSYSIGAVGPDGTARTTCATDAAGVHAASCDHSVHTQSREW